MENKMDPDVEVGKWYIFNWHRSNHYRIGQAIKVLYEPEEIKSGPWKGISVTTWPMGPERTEDENGIMVMKNQLWGSGHSSPHEAKEEWRLRR